MAELPDDEQPGQDPQTNRDPLWNTLQDLAPEGPAHEAMSEIVGRLNDYQQKSELVQANEQAGANFVNDISGWKNGMEAAVKNDPLFVHTAMDVTVPFLQGTAGAIPGADPAHVDTLIRDMHHDLATMSVYTAAEQNGDLARSLLGNERIKGSLSEEEQGALGRYIGFQDDARARDAQAQQQVAQARATSAQDGQALKYMGVLGNYLPPDFHSQVLADTDLTPEMKGALGDLGAKIMREGDNEFHDPFALEGLVRRMAGGERIPATDFISGVTRGELRLDDADLLSRVPQKEAGALLQHLISARQILMGVDGENGAAGAQAYANFTNYFIGEYQDSGPGGLDPRSERWIMRSDGGNTNYAAQVLNHFKPSGDDLIFSNPWPMMNNTAEYRPMNTLDSIFGNKGPVPGDELISNTPNPLARPGDFIDHNKVPEKGNRAKLMAHGAEPGPSDDFKEYDTRERADNRYPGPGTIDILKDRAKGK